MTREQYEKLKEYIEAVSVYQLAKRLDRERWNESLNKDELERELDKLMFPEGNEE